MKKKFIICLLVSLTFSMLIPLFVIDVYEPLDQLVSEEFQATIDSSEPYIHETKKLGLFEKLGFYFSSVKAFTHYLEIVWVWFVALFVATSISIFLNTKITSNKRT